MRHTAQIVNASSVRAAIKARSSGALPERKSAGRRWAISFGLIGFDGCADKCTSRSTRRGADGRPAHITSGGSANDRPGRRSVTRPLTGWRITRSESQRSQSKPRNDCEMIFLHSVESFNRVMTRESQVKFKNSSTTGSQCERPSPLCSADSPFQRHETGRVQFVLATRDKPTP